MPRIGGLAGSEANVSRACGSVERERCASMAAEGALQRHERVHECDGAVLLARMSRLVAAASLWPAVLCDCMSIARVFTQLY